MTITLAFDVYGTLIDTQGVVVALERHLGARAPEFSRAWRDKQLEYSFRRGLMQTYETFAVCTSQALDHTCDRFQLPLGAAERQALLEAYRTLPAFPDAVAGLAKARAQGFRLFAFSNGSAEAVEALLRHAGIRDSFLDVVSVDEVRSFKPDPAVYAHFLKRAGSIGAETWLVSGNPFDVLGALGAGLRGAWVRRSPEVPFDPWRTAPTLTVRNLAELPDQVRVMVGPQG
jgi:2-haloacid dehalogenase